MIRTLSTIVESATVHRRGDDSYGSREYLLLPPNTDLDNADEWKIASLHAHRNIVFGARAFQNRSLVEVCTPLLNVALTECSKNGEQPQAISALYGLCRWVSGSLETNEMLRDLQDSDPVAFEAVKAISTGVPRPGHSIVGRGTFRDGEVAWTQLAKAFVEAEPPDECQLYLQAGGELVGIESLADTKPDYLKSAGGAMARFFFL
jgi:hypothetical protein